jgi:DNA-binding transcriptional ArsR family regulator
VTVQRGVDRRRTRCRHARAAVLRLLSGGHTTGDIARRSGISAASASEPAAALRAAGLTVSRPDGKAVCSGPVSSAWT